MLSFFSFLFFFDTAIDVQGGSPSFPLMTISSEQSQTLWNEEISDLNTSLVLEHIDQNIHNYINKN